MKAVGIICEYNPFHKGHLYHLNETKKMFPGQPIIVVLSGNFCQRGEPSIINKWKKTKIALEYGADIVVELPFAYATQSADIFAEGSIRLLDSLKINNLVFGSESNDLNKLIEMADIQLNNDSYQKIVKDYMEKGINYPTALGNALEDILNKKIKTPNDILGISYIREIKKLNSNIIPHTIKRTNDYNSKTIENEIASATSIREALKNNENIIENVPTLTYDYLQDNLHFLDDYFPFLKYKILTEKTELSKYQTVDEGIENRISSSILEAKSIDELINLIKTKRYTYNKIRRMLTHILCNFTKEEAQNKKIDYIRVLGFSKKGQKYLNHIRKDLDLPIITNFSKGNPNLNLELRVTSVYASILEEREKNETIKAEYKSKPIQKK